MSFILYILTFLVYQDVMISAHVGAVIMELFFKITVKTCMVIIHGRKMHVHDNIIQLKPGYKINITII